MRKRDVNKRQTEEDHTRFPLLEEAAALIVCALKVIISSHWFSQSIIRWLTGFFWSGLERRHQKALISIIAKIHTKGTINWSALKYLLDKFCFSNTFWGDYSFVLLSFSQGSWQLLWKWNVAGTATLCAIALIPCIQEFWFWNHRCLGLG